MNCAPTGAEREADCPSPLCIATVQEHTVCRTAHRSVQPKPLNPPVIPNGHRRPILATTRREGSHAALLRSMRSLSRRGSFEMTGVMAAFKHVLSLKGT